MHETIKELWDAVFCVGPCRGYMPVTPQAMWPIVKSLKKRDRPKATSAIHSPLGPIFYPNEKAYIIAMCLANQFRVYDLCDCDYSQHVEAKVEALLATIHEGIQ
jgi:hypothetical protein